MSNKVLILMATVLIFSTSQLQADVTHSTWVGGEGGRWGDASNWSPYGVPDNSSWRTFAVTIDSNSIGVDEIEVRLQQSWTIDQLDCYGKVELERWTRDWIELTLTDANGLTNYGSLDIGRLNISGNITNVAGADCYLREDDYMEIRGNIYNQANAKLELEGDVGLEGNFNLENAGTVWMWGPGVQFYSDGTINNTGQINLVAADCGANKVINSSSGVIRGWGNIGTEDEGELLQNEGLISASGGSLLIVTEKNAISNDGILRSEPGCFLHVKSLFLGPDQADVNNLGKIEVKGGGCVTFYCNLSNQANGQVELLAGNIAATTITQSADANFAGFGTISGNVTIEANGLINLTGPTNIIGDVNVPSGATLQISDGQTLITGHTSNEGAIRVVNGDVIFQGGYSGSGLVQKD